MKIANSRLKENLLIVTYFLLLAFVLINLSNILGFLGNFISMIKPFIIGLGIAFTTNLLVKLYEGKLIPLIDKNNILSKYKRSLSIILSILTLLILFWALLVFVLPQFADSIKILLDSIPEYMKSLEGFVAPYVSSTEILSTLWENLVSAWKDVLQFAGQFLGQSITGIINTTFTITSSIFTIIISFVIAIYMLISKEQLILGLKKVIYAIFSKKIAENIMYVGEISNITFSKFIGGQCIEAVIVGILCFIGMLLFKMPYPMLISVIIGATNIIPVFGPFIGTIPSAFILLMIDPSKALAFIIFIVVLQQLESNLIYPRVVGGSIGLSAIWVLFAITVGGGFFRLIGMLLGVPTVAVIYRLVKDSIDDRLEKKEIKL